MDWLLPLAFGSAIGFTIGMTGVGGGVLIFPTLTAVFGLSEAQAVATAFVFALVSQVSALTSHLRLGNVLGRLGALIGVGGIPAVILMSLVLKRFESLPALGWVVRGAFLVILGICLSSMLKGGAEPQPAEDDAPGIEGDAEIAEVAELDELGRPPPPPIQPVRSLAVGFGTGLVLGLTSVGGGVIVIPMLERVFGTGIRRAVGTACLIALILATCGAFSNLENIDGRLAFGLLIGALPAAFLGARASSKVSAQTVRRLVISLMILAAVGVFVR